MGYFGESTQRIQEFREELLNTPSYICAERGRLYTQAYRQHRDEPVILQRANCVANVLEHMSIFIEKQTLLVGNQASLNRAAPLFPEYCMDWVVEELDTFEKRDGDVFHVREEEKAQIRELGKYWDRNTLKDKGLAALPSEYRKIYDLGIIKMEGSITSGDAHLAVNYDELIRLGLRHFRTLVEEYREKLDLTDYRNLEKRYFYDAALIMVDSSIAFAHRFSELAKQEAEKERDEKRKKELEEIARICSRVPEYPAETMWEALQSIWLVHLILQIESNGHSLSYGRLDQYLYPFYKKDLEEGRVTEESACELLENLWLKTFTINKVRSWAHTQFSAGSPMYQNVTVGGQTTEGKDATNPVSWLILKSVARMHLPQPNLTVRYHKNLPQDFMRECMQVIKLGFGMPAFNNDEIIIPSFVEKGVALEDARNYSAIGCVEVAVPGKWGYRCTGMSFSNLPRFLLAMMNGGVDLTSGERVLPECKPFLEIESYEEVFAEWKDTAEKIARMSVVLDNCADTVIEQETPDVLCSVLVDDCVKRGLDLKSGGAVYDFISGLQVGIANLGDSLEALKVCVFEKKLLTKEEVWEALLHNYEGEEGERVRQILIREAPKYGNDEEEVDRVVADAYSCFINEIVKYKNTRFGRGPIGGGYYAGTSSISANVPQGGMTMATPDGRKAKTPLAEGCSPQHGVDVHGPTSVFKSISKLPTHLITGGVLLNQKMNHSVLENEADTEKLISIIRAFFDSLKGFHVQYNVVSRETMRAAQKNPEEYRDLIVRVAGYSAFFNSLSRQTQDDIIERTEHTV